MFRTINLKRPPAVPKWHNCEYVQARSAFVPQAEKIANERVVIHLASEDGGMSQANWVRCYAAEMERLSRPLLLKQSGNGAHEITKVSPIRNPPPESPEAKAAILALFK
jgi:hypothetical protein